MEHWLFGLGVNPIRSSTSAAGVRKHCRRGRNGGQGERRPGTLLGPEGTAALLGLLHSGPVDLAW